MRPFRYGGLITYAEDLMAAQAARGHSVGYFFSGRHYPFVSGPRLKRWSRGGISMYEIVNTTIAQGGDRGTLRPDEDLRHPASEAAFGHVVGEFGPDVVHLHELLGLPSSIIDVVHAHGVPVIMTAQDYFPLCPTIKLYDADGRLCMRDRVGEQCARCCRDAPVRPDPAISATAIHDVGRLVDRMPGLRRLPRPRKVADLVGTVATALAAAPSHGPPAGLDGDARAAAPAVAEAYQRRREVNVTQLNKLDRLVAQSKRLAEIYERHGVDGSRITPLQFTLGYLESLTPRTFDAIDGPVHFATSNGCASEQKGAGVVLGALRALHDHGLGDRFVFSAFGYVAPDVARQLDAFPNVRRPGTYGEHEIEQAFGDVHVGVIPSVWEEAYGYVGPELLAQGIPIIGNVLGGIPEYTRDGETGWLNRTNDAVGLARIMEDIVRAPHQVVALNRKVVARRADLIKPIDRHVSEIEAVYRSVAAGD